METLKYTKVRKVKSPIRAHAEDAGLDFYVPEDLYVEQLIEKCNVTGDQLEIDSENGVISAIHLKPGQSVLIPSGIHVKVPFGYMLVYMNKSGIASKHHLHVGACVTGNTIVKTNHGNFTASTLTKNFCDKNGILINALNLKTNTIEQHVCDGFRRVKVSKCLRVTFDDGTVIEGDEEHQIWHDNKWVMLKDL